MKAGAAAARIDFDAGGEPLSVDYGDRYHPQGGAFAQARAVFLAGNCLPERWAGRQRFVILETGFGLGNNFLATWATWRDDARRCEHLWFLSVDKHPPSIADLRRAHAASPAPALAAALIDRWPPATHDLHVRHFAEGRLHLLLAFGDIADWLPQWMAEVNAFYLDGFAPAKNPAMWQPQVFKHLNRLAAVGATAATWSCARIVRDGLTDAGFEVQLRKGFDAKRDRLEARHQPRHRAVRPPGRRFDAEARSTAVIGAGLAGAAVARALASLGATCTVFDACAAAAEGGSGQAAGLLHAVVHAQDSPHTRWYRAAALHASATIAPLIAQQRVAGRLEGLLRLERTLDLPAMQRLLERCALPDTVVRALSRDAAAERVACPLTAPAWWYGDGGWVDPRSLVRAWLEPATIELRLHACVERLQRAGADGRWQLIDASRHTLGEFDAVVLANAHDAPRLAASARSDEAAALHWPLSRSRGQVSQLAPELGERWRPALPVAGAGYAITLPDDGLLFGATQTFDDDDGALRAADHRHNLGVLQALSGLSWPIDTDSLHGRVAWRTHARDRLPLVGAVASAVSDGTRRRDQPRFIAREPGLFVLAALGSRGLTQAALAGEVVAAMITGAPLPLGSPLLDAIDAARFEARALRVSTPGS